MAALGEEHAALRLRGGGEEPPRVFGSLAIDIAGREALLDGEPIALTRTDLSKRRSGTDFWSSAPGGTRFGALTPVQASSLGS